MDRQDIKRLLDAHMFILSTPNVVRINYGTKVVGGTNTRRPALVIGVIKKLPASAIQSPDLTVPRTVSIETADGRLDLETDVVEEGEIVMINGTPVPGSSLIITDGLEDGGTLGVNIDYDGTYRLLSCAHVLTFLDESYIGKMVNYCDELWKNPKPLAPVSGMVPVTYYTSKKHENPTRNRQDLAWADISPDLGSPEILKIGTPSGIRAPVEDERVMVYGGRSNRRIQETTVLNTSVWTSTKLVAANRKPDLYTFWEDVIEIDAGDLFLQPGDSGSAIVAVKDKALIGLAFSLSPFRVYACPLVL